MKARIQEALRRRHRKGDEGFTLIELLVVILIIAILAAVGIVALLSALNAGKKSSAQTSLRNAIVSVKSAQTGAGQQDYDGIGVGTAIDLNDEDPDLTWVNGGVGAEANNISVVNGAGNIIQLATKSANEICYFVTMDANGETVYSSGDAAGADCNATGAATNPAPNNATGAGNTKAGWSFTH